MSKCTKTQKALCKDLCDICFERCFLNYKGKTKNGKLKVECWDSEMNGDIIPREVTYFSNLKYWFKCDICFHSFEKVIGTVTKSTWCPYCSIPVKKVCDNFDCTFCYNNSFISYEGKTKNDKLKVECWDHEMNDEIKPRNIIINSNKKFWFKCDQCFHSFEMIICSITSKKKIWCPYCSIPVKKLCDNIDCKHCYNNSFIGYKGKTKNDKLKVECWDHEMNDEIKPRDIMKGSKEKKWFKCDQCFHSFEMIIYSVTSKAECWCPYCSIPVKKLCDNEKCKHCYKNSFISYKGKTKNNKLKVDCYNIKKNKINPRFLSMNSHTKCWFDCDVCDHPFETTIKYITCKKPNWCPYCAIPSKKKCKNKECLFCYNKSFISYKGKTKNGKLKIDCWNDKMNNDIQKKNIIKHCNKKFWFTCDICNHNLNISIVNIVLNNIWCSYCSAKKICCDKDCTHCYNKSFASYKGITTKGKLKIDCLINEINLRDIAKHSGKKYYFNCDICDNNFEKRIIKITSNNSWCPYCKNKTEGKFKYWFETKYSEYILKYQAKYNWCKNIDTNKHLFFDFVIEDLKLIIEIDGEQHFRQVSNWSTPDERFEFDKYKMEEAMRNDYSIVRILQEDIYYDKNEWEIKFDKILKKYEKPTVICIGCKTLYNKYLEVKDVDQVRNELKYKCDCCNISFKFMSGYKRHCKTNKHQTNLKSLELSPLTV